MKTKNNGFTLIEVMVAIGVIAIALPALLFSMMEQIDGTAYMRDKLQAQWVAENVLEQARIQNHLNGAVPAEQTSGEEELGERKWIWKSRSKAFEQKELKDIYGLEVSVWSDVDVDKEDPLVKMVGIIRKHEKQTILRQGGSGNPNPNLNPNNNSNLNPNNNSPESTP